MADPARVRLAARQTAQSGALARAFPRIAGCDLFRDALTAFEDASFAVRGCTDESKPQRAAAEVLDRMMTDMVYAVADFHCAQAVFDILGALDALDRDEIT
jgi:predicted deacylase